MKSFYLVGIYFNTIILSFLNKGRLFPQSRFFPLSLFTKPLRLLLEFRFLPLPLFTFFLLFLLMLLFFSCYLLFAPPFFLYGLAP